MQEQDHQHLDEIIKRSFEKSSKGAPDGLWRNLSSALDAGQGDSGNTQLPQDPLDIKLRESFSSINKSVPGHVWPAINRQLNIEKVWQGISSELGKTKPLYRPAIRRIAAAVLLLLLSAAGAYVMLPDNALLQPLAKSAASGPTEMNESADLKKPITEKGPAENVLQQPQANTSHAALAIKPVSSMLKNSSSQLPLAGAESQSLHSDNARKEMPAVKQEAKGLLTSEEAIAETVNALDHKQSGPAPATAKAAKDNTFYDARLAASGAKAVDQLEAESNAHASRPEQPVVSTVASSAVPKLKAVQGASSAVMMVSDQKTGSVAKENRASLATQNPVPAESAGAQASFGASGLVKGVSFNLALENGKIEVPVVPVDSAAVPQEAQQEMLAQLWEEQAAGRLKNKRFQAGPVMVYHNSWLLNNETKSSYDKSSLIATDLTYKQNWGLVLNYRLGSRSFIASEGHISKAGQQYKMYQQGEYLKKDLELSYYKLYLQYQHNFLAYGKTFPSWLTVKAGAYGGYLYKKRGELRTEESKYDQLDYGVRLALGQETAIGNFVLGYGVSAERGLNNVFRGTERLPAEFNKTYLLNLGSYINLRYSF